MLIGIVVWWSGMDYLACPDGEQEVDEDAEPVEDGEEDGGWEVWTECPS
jgi:hypothetical protein